MSKLGPSPFMNFATAIGIGPVNCKGNCEEKKTILTLKSFVFSFLFFVVVVYVVLFLFFVFSTKIL